MTLESLRARLDELDRQLLELIAERQAVVEEVGSLKRTVGQATRDYAREKHVLDAARQRAEDLGVSPDTAEQVMRLLIQDGADPTGACQSPGRRAGQRQACPGDWRWRQDGALVR